MLRQILAHGLSRMARIFGREIIPSSRTLVEQELLWARNMQRIGGQGSDILLYLSQPVENVHLKWLLDLRRITTVLDVGANHGQFHDKVRNIGFNGNIHCFEPQPEVQTDLLARAGSHARTTIHPYALGREEAELNLTRFEDDSFSSFHAASAQGLSSFGKEFRPVLNQAVPVHRMADIWSSLGTLDASRCLLKTDTQGHDMAVLEGAGDLLNIIPLVVTEAPIIPLYENTASFIELCAFLAARGLHLSGIYPVSYDPETGALLELNAWYSRHPASPNTQS